MRTAFKVLLFVSASLLVLALCAYAWVEASYERDFSSTPVPKIVASKDPAVISQGDYVVHALAHCSACHQPVYYMRKRQLTLSRNDLRGGFQFEAGPFGTFYAANLSSDVETGLGAVDDGVLARAIRHGVDRHGRFAAFMALSVGAMADQDLTAVISYLRSLPPKRNPVPQDEWGIAAKALSSKFVAHDEPPQVYVAPGTVSIERGRYLANGPAGCYTCHSQRDAANGFAFVGPKFAGNPDAEPDELDADYELTAPNLTPDPTTGRIALWNEEQFLSRFKTGRMVKASHMPWENFAQMTDADKRSIYRYLHSLAPVQRDVGPSRRPRGWKARE
jgi:mono/diheme cytochrome c family protein